MLFLFPYFNPKLFVPFVIDLSLYTLFGRIFFRYFGRFFFLYSLTLSQYLLIIPSFVNVKIYVFSFDKKHRDKMKQISDSKA